MTNILDFENKLRNLFHAEMEIRSPNREKITPLSFLSSDNRLPGQLAITCQKWWLDMRRPVISCARAMTSQRFSLQGPTIATPVDIDVSRPTRRFVRKAQRLSRNNDEDHESADSPLRAGETTH
ncbi:hypothetical protein HNY73_022198 [Argiope bruennichi]|uniref:Uncharacterized protein n=1 Tax=Argiope bruennichi TaxID=94029 RepID=A0A8T0E3Q8_ARGBR|nr:hypothetical protein HNY73_022198 [Argiope bruennichi]